MDAAPIIRVIVGFFVEQGESKARRSVPWRTSAAGLGGCSSSIAILEPLSSSRARPRLYRSSSFGWLESMED